MELSQRLDLGKLGLSGASEPDPATPLEGDELAQLAGLLVRVGAVDDADEVSRDDTLDSLGVDSLTRIELAVRAEEHFGVRVEEETFASLTTLGDAAEFFADHADTADSASDD